MKRTPLKRKVPISKKHRKTKGAIGENELIPICRRVWPEMRRNFMSGAQGGSDFVNTPGWAVEAKRQETTKPWAWYEQCQEAASQTEIPLVVFRRNHSDWMALLSLDDLLGIIEQGLA